MKLFRKKPVTLDMTNILIDKIICNNGNISCTLYGNYQNRIPKRLKKKVLVTEIENRTIIKTSIKTLDFFEFCRHINKILAKI